MNDWFNTFLTLSWRRPLSYKKQFIDLQSKSVDCFLYNGGLLHERVNNQQASRFFRQLLLLYIKEAISRKEKFINYNKRGNCQANLIYKECSFFHNPIWIFVIYGQGNQKPPQMFIKRGVLKNHRIKPVPVSF